MKKLNWSNIDLSADKKGYGRIRVTAQVSKTNSNRTALLPPNAIQLLKPHAPSKENSGSKLYPVNFNKKKKQLKELAGISWPNNCLRHTAGTAWYNKCRNLREVAEQLGNSEEISREFYIEQVVWDKRVDEFFEIGTTPSRSV